MSEFTEKQYLLWLSNVSGMTNIRVEALLAHFGNACEIYSADTCELRGFSFMSETMLDDLTSKEKAGRIDELCRKIESSDTKYITKFEPEYPFLLNAIYDSPLLLYYRGTIPDNRLPNISIVGTRKCSEYGVNAAHLISRNLAKCGVTIVSGMARGLDSAAHLGALEGGGLTVAVLGCGVDICYPPENKSLMEKIQNNGCVVSEFPLGTPALKAYFPKRNRIVSGLSLATVVVEADEKSGTEITANLALEQGRDVFAVPGSIFSKQSIGTNNMLKNGAIPLTNYMDVINYLANTASIDFGVLPDEEIEIEPNLDDDNESSVVYKHIKSESITIDELISLTGLSAQKTLVALTKLENRGLIERLPGQRCIKSIR